MDDPKHGDMFIIKANNKEEGDGPFLGTVTGYVETKDDVVHVQMNFMSIKNGQNFGNGSTPIDSLKTNVKNGDFVKVTEEELQVWKILFTVP